MNVTGDTVSVDPLLESTISFEMRLLGSCLRDNSRIPEVLEHVTPDSFYRGAHQAIVHAIKRLHDSDSPADVVSVADVLAREDSLERVGGTGYLWELYGSVPETSSAGWYAQKVAEKAALRRIVQICQEGCQLAAEQKTKTDDVIGRILGGMEDVQRKRSFHEALQMRDLADRFLAKLEKGPTQANCLKTGTYAFDGIIGGLPNGVVSLSGRTKEGKTTVAQWWTIGFARQGPVLFATAEVDTDTLFERFVAMEARVKNNTFRHDTPSDIDMERIRGGVGRLSEMPIWVLGTHEPSCSQVHAVARTVERREGRRLSAVVIDRLEKMPRSHHDAVQNVQVQMHDVAVLQRKLNVPVIILCQLRKGDEQQNPQWRPTLDDLLGSSAIKQDSQMVCFVHRDSYNDPESKIGPGRIIVAKNNEGPEGVIPILWQAEYPAFVDLAR